MPRNPPPGGVQPPDSGTGGAEPCGVLVVDKPAGPTSHDVVARIRALYRTRRVGHAGTLDPPATGILLVGLGRATRVLQFLQALPKCYRANIAFGTTTSTQDATGEVLATRPCAFDRNDLLGAMARLTGPIEQVPPMVSAVRVGGERLYAAARRGEEVERAPRPVTVYDFSLESFDSGAWSATVRVRCSSGTYVRTLAADVGEALGCGAHLSALRRLSVGSLSGEQAVTLPALEAMSPEDRAAAVLTPASALRDLKAVPVEGDSLEGVRHGRALEPAGGEAADGEPLAILTPEGDLVAVYRRDGAAFKAACVLA
ncbi:MAG: tRNA pseudouridine(55) synthase TruB [Actinomycetota bacterium]